MTHPEVTQPTKRDLNLLLQMEPLQRYNQPEKLHPFFLHSQLEAVFAAALCRPEIANLPNQELTIHQAQETGMNEFINRFDLQGVITLFHNQTEVNEIPFRETDGEDTENSVLPIPVIENWKDEFKLDALERAVNIKIIRLRNDQKVSEITDFGGILSEIGIYRQQLKEVQSK